MNKMITRTALVATLALSALSLTACGSSNDCPRAEQSNTVTATTAMVEAKPGGGRGGRSSSSSNKTSKSSNSGFNWFWMGGGSSSEKCHTQKS